MNIKTTKSEYKTEIFTGIRPTGSLTVANYFGAVKPIIKLQELESGIKPLVFVADLHALTDNEPKDVKNMSMKWWPITLRSALIRIRPICFAIGD